MQGRILIALIAAVTAITIAATVVGAGASVVSYERGICDGIRATTGTDPSAPGGPTVTVKPAGGLGR